MEIVELFTIPLWHAELPDFNNLKRSFINAAYDYKKRNPEGVSVSNITGYQSPSDLMHEPRFKPLFDFVCQMANNANLDNCFEDCDISLTSAWVNINDTRNAYNLQHVHGDTYAGVFYLDTPDGSGKIRFVNSSMNALWQGDKLSKTKNRYTAGHSAVIPCDGHVYLWPSYLPHSVLPNRHDQVRVSISFNILCTPRNDKQ